jgi:hypothetical protein
MPTTTKRPTPTTPRGIAPTGTVTEPRRPTPPTAPPAEFSIPASLDLPQVLRRARETFYQDDNVIGVGVGPRRVDHELRPNEIALLVYVQQKLPLSALDPAKVIPKEFMGLRTDVIAPISAHAEEETVDYVREHHLIHDMSNIDWARLHELSSRTEAPIVPHAVTVQDFGDICVVEDDGTVVKTAPDGTQYVDFIRAYQLFRSRHGDDYDFVTFFADTVSGMPPVCGCSFWSGIYSDVQGIGMGTYNGRPSWGTARLQGFQFMNQGHFPIWRYVMLQEFGHQFASFVKYRDPVTNATMNDHLLPDQAHWALNLDDDRSPMDYDVNNWIELPNGQFRKVTLSDDQRTYCNLDLYLMGLLGPSEVGEFYLLRNPAPVGGSSTDFTATPVRLNVQNFIAQEGPRIPTSATAPKYWRQAFIVLTKDIHKAHDLVDTVDFLRLRWERDFMEATKLLGRIDTVLDARPGRITPSQIMELTRGGYTTLHRHRVGPSDLQVVNTQFVGSLTAGQTRSWFTYNWPADWFVTWSLRPTTGGGKIRWDVAIERAGNGTFTYWLTVTNVGPSSTNFEGKYAILK